MGRSKDLEIVEIGFDLCYHICRKENEGILQESTHSCKSTHLQ